MEGLKINQFLKHSITLARRPGSTVSPSCLRQYPSTCSCSHPLAVPMPQLFSISQLFPVPQLFLVPSYSHLAVPSPPDVLNLPAVPTQQLPSPPAVPQSQSPAVSSTPSPSCSQSPAAPTLQLFPPSIYSHPQLFPSHSFSDHCCSRQFLQPSVRILTTWCDYTELTRKGKHLSPESCG